MAVNAGPDGPLRTLAALVVKDGVALGGLPSPQQELALALVWAGLPEDGACDEPRINEALKTRLAGAAVFLDTDHVELRRRLVDAGWLTRDGYGRAYRRVAGAAMPASQRALADSLAGIDTAAWVAEARRAHRATREARRVAWQVAQGGQGRQA